MRILQGNEPASVLAFFEDICSIPHISYHEQQLSDYCVAFAKERNLYYEQDKLGNVVIIKEATKGYEDKEPIMIQGHLDMVGDKVPGCDIDMEKESIRILVDGDLIRAEGTTLGGDDGIAVAYGLALLDAEDIPHPRLELILTVSEEVGLLGATAIDLSCCRAKRLLNIDSEEEGVFTAGCAGGLRVDCIIPMNCVEKNGMVWEIKTSGLLGGHSGIEIDRGRANANVLLGRFLLFLQNKVPYEVVSMAGGVKDNVIPKNATVRLMIAQADEVDFANAVTEFEQILDLEYGAADPDIKLITEQIKKDTCSVLTDDAKNKVLTALNVMPNGVQTMSQDLPGLVETSLNMGVLSIDEKEMKISFALRSSLASAKEYLKERLRQITKFLGGEIECRGEYPGWPYARDSKFRDLCVKVYEKQYGKAPKIEVIHAGLECGILSSKVEGLDCISIGPNMANVHTPEEIISISSIQRVWEFIKGILAE